MAFIVSTTVRIHTSACDSFVQWAARHGEAFAALRTALETSKGKPAGAIPLENGRWIWASGDTFVSYVLNDKPVFWFGRLGPMPLLRHRAVIVTDIRALPARQ